VLKRDDAVDKIIGVLQTMQDAQFDVNPAKKMDGETIAVLQGEIAKLQVDIAPMLRGKIADLQAKVDNLLAKNYDEILAQAKFDLAWNLAQKLATDLGHVDAPVVESAQTVKRKVSYKLINDRLYAPDGSGEIVGFVTGNKTSDGMSMAAIAGWALPAGHELKLDGWLIGYLAGDGLFIKAVTSSGHRISGEAKQMNVVSNLLNDCDTVWAFNRSGINQTPFSQNQNARAGKFLTADDISKLDVLDVRG
jgi:hypothetical protein